MRFQYRKKTNKEREKGMKIRRLVCIMLAALLLSGCQAGLDEVTNLSGGVPQDEVVSQAGTDAETIESILLETEESLTGEGEPGSSIYILEKVQATPWISETVMKDRFLDSSLFMEAKTSGLRRIIR